MSSARPAIPPQATEAQTRASDPATSAFVSANAGSGKTHVLVQRVVRLLLAGVPPAKILCITFTKAAAANMSQRVFSKLGEWVALSDDALDKALRESGIARPTAQIRTQARKLFASALETPGGLKVQTIHALCTRLLQQFPFEANVPARFTVLDERDQTEIMERARLQVLLDAAAQPDSAAGRALRVAMANAADIIFKDVINEAVLSRDRMYDWIARTGSIDAAMTELSAALGIAPDLSLSAIETDIVDGPHLPHADWTDVAAILSTGKDSDIEQADKLRKALTLTGPTQVDAYLSVFLTTTDQTFKSRIVTSGVSKPRPDIAAAFDAEKARLGPLLDRRRAALMRERTHALLVIATAVAENYQREKQARAALDYDDLIDRTLAMLDRTSAGWVHYKLDRGIDHVLIDEAQDTSPTQWDIISRIIGDFTSGAGARQAKRTIFAVGDEKQSIFSFQGAVPQEFDLRRRRLAAAFRDAELPFEKILLNYSFRSGLSILNGVDAVFREPDKYASIHAIENERPIHEALPGAAPAVIDLWDCQDPPAKNTAQGWRAPFDAVSRTNPEAVLADRIQREIGGLVARGERTGPRNKRRKLTYGDMLVLVRRRGKAFDAVIKALKHAGIPVAGADRLKLIEHIAVIDLITLGDALLLGHDDLALAVALKSPLFGFDEDQLFALAHDRKGSLRNALRTKAADGEPFTSAERRLRACEERAADSPFAFYAWLLGADRGRARMLARLGTEANDAIDEFLELALAFERKHPASLQGFLAWLRAADTDVKRDMELVRDEVRVMTVHGAKGLEAPVVFLADTTATPAETQRLHLLRLASGNAAPGAAGMMVWASKKIDDPTAAATARASMQDETNDEYRRLLYVAMTRAADRLIVGGCKPGNRKDILHTSWYAMIRDGLRQAGLTETPVETKDGVVLRYTRPLDWDETESVEAILPEPLPLTPPDWLRAPTLRGAAPPAPLRPSKAGGIRKNAPSALREDRARALQRGTLVHRLLQSLPDIPHERRRDAALRFLTRNATGTGGWTDAERDALATQVLALMDDARFANLFAAGSRAEAPIAGRLPELSDTPVSGQIDRLLIAPDQIWIVDYKTNANAPRRLDDVPQAYIRQLALYRRVLALAYPGRSIRAALLWTETPEIMEIPAANLDQAMAALISS